ncbi:uncharacterized protein LOC144909170 [Branchiostoma floridae x Branchiostoma belcheri]
MMRQCLTLTAPANGALSTTATIYQTVVNFTCNPGYVLNGTTNTTCQADGTWSNLVPTCRVRQCPTLTALANGVLSTTATSYQTVVNFTCNPGYVLNGTTNTTCQADGTWRNLVPTCRVRQCPTLTAPANGALSTTATSYLTVVNFTCNPGYVLNGTTNTTCQADGTWSNLVPTCRVRQCPTLTAPANGALSTTATSYQTVVNLTCNPGYVLNGTTNTTCQADGTWSNLVPTCRVRQCPTLTAPANGALSTTATIYQTVVNYTCNPGYVLNGTTNTTCQANGTWGNPVPTCTPNIALSSTATSYQTVVNFTCNPGYVLNGTSNTTCQADGTWSNLVPTCRVRQCPTLTAPANGALSTTATSYQIVVNFTCNTGYVLNGTTNTTCQADGTWSNLVPTCRVRQCPTLTAPANGALSTTATSYQTVVNFTCNPGYVLNGTTNTTCQDDGTWSNLVPTCRVRQCPTLTAPANGALSTTTTSYQTVVNFTCNPGYLLNGTTNTTCQADGTWSNLVPTCRVRQCPSLTAPANGALSSTATSYQTVVNFTCNPGYVVNGTTNTTCQADGTWSNLVPTCRVRQCPTLTAPANGALSTTATSYQTVVNFTCNPGYVLNGTTNTTCQADGTWRNLVPTCRVRQCPTLTAPANGALSTTATSYQTVVNFTCNLGYVLNRTTNTTCQADGTWSNPIPTCRVKQCPTLTVPANGALSTTATSYQTVVTFTCNQGYRLDGASSATCQADGTWSNPFSTCRVIKCPLLSPPTNGSLSPVGSNTYLDVVTFSCDHGYELDGSTSATCQGDGTWSANVPTCNVVSCPNLLAPPNGSLSPVGSNTYLDVVTFSCDQGYELDGSTSATCQGDGTWSASVPECNDIDACLVRPCVTEATCADNPAPSLDATCTCNTGYTGDGHFLGTGCSVYTASTISPPVTCQAPCHAQATCQDVGSNPNCQCNTGWAGNGINCFDIDECRRKPFPCNKAKETCLNTAGSYRCGCRPWLIRFQGNCKALHRVYVRLVYNASYDYEPEKHAPGGVQYEQSKREHLRHLNYMIDSIPEITRFGNPGFRRFERGSLVTFQSVTLLEGEMPLQPKTLEEHLQTYMKQNEQNSSFTFAGATVAVTDLNECSENRATCPQGSTCVNTPGGYGCTYCSPEVAIIGGGMSIPRSRAFRLTSRFSVGVNCTEQFDITYRWEALPSAATHWQELSDIVTTAVDIVSTKADLLVPFRTLNYGTYLFRLTVTVNETDTGITVSRTSNSASVSITASSLIAGILGGFRRQVGTGKVTLDAATLSSDPDGVIPMSKDLNYRWSCTPTGLGGVCPVLDGRDEGLLTVNLGLETLHKELTFTVEVSAPGRDAVSASQIVEVVRSTIPLTSIICDRTYGTCGPKINAGEKMRLFLECSNCRAGLDAYTYRWTLMQRTSQGSVTTWTDQDWNRNILNDRNQDYLTFRAGVFDKDGAYTVTAMVTDSNSTESGSSEYSFTLNEPPTVGTCAVHASDTSEGSFEIQCQGFYDSDLPLRYDFEYTPADVTVASVNSTDDSSNQLLLYSGPASSTPPIRLPTGNPDRNYELEIVVRVADALGAFANTSVTTHVRPPEHVEEFVETVLDNLDVDDVQQTTSSITSVASVLNVANGSDVEDTTRIEARDRMVDILEQVEVLDLQQVKQVSSTLEHVINKPEELSDESQVKAADTLKTLEEVLTTQSSELGAEELEKTAAHLVSGAVNVLDASSQSAGKKRKEAQLQNRTSDFQKNEEATTTAFQAIDNLALAMIDRKYRDEKPTLVQAKDFVMSLARSGCEGLGARFIQTGGETKAYFQIPENTTTNLCVNGTVGSQTYFTPQNPFEYANNAGDVRTPVVGLSVLGDRRKLIVRNLEEDERIESINPVQNTATPVNGTAMSSNGRQITVHRFNTSEPGVAFYVRVNPDVSGDDANVTLRAYLKRGDVVTPGDYSHNVTLTRNGYNSDGRTMTGMQPYSWFLNQSTLNISDEHETWAIGIQRVPTVDENGEISDSMVLYNTSITAYKCISFDETMKTWTDNGCKVGSKTTDGQLHCICDRLTPAFAGFVAPNPLDLGSSFTFDLDRSVIALVTVCVVMALYIVTVFIGRSADLADERKVCLFICLFVCLFVTVCVVMALYIVAVFIGRSADLNDERKRQKKTHNQLSKTKGKGYLSHHLWVSVVKFPSGHFTRVQRISCCLSLLMSFMLVNIMFYRGDRDLLSKITIGDVELSLPISLTSFIIGLESSLIALPINVFIVVLFRYSGTRQKASTSLHTSEPKNKSRYGVTLKDQHIGELVLPRYLPKVQNLRSEFNAEYTADPTDYIERLKKDAALKKVDTRYVIKKEGSKVTVNHKPYRPFPWWCRIVAWLLVAAIVVVSGAFTVLYGNDHVNTDLFSLQHAWLLVSTIAVVSGSFTVLYAWLLVAAIVVVSGAFTVLYGNDHVNTVLYGNDHINTDLFSLQPGS